MFITTNIIPEISAFLFSFGSVAKQSLAKLRNIRTSDDVLRMNVMISCYALSCRPQCCHLVCTIPGEVLPMMAYTGRLRPKGVSFSGFMYMKG